MNKKELRLLLPAGDYSFIDAGVGRIECFKHKGEASLKLWEDINGQGITCTDIDLNDEDEDYDLNILWKIIGEEDFLFSIQKEAYKVLHILEDKIEEIDEKIYFNLKEEIQYLEDDRVK